MACEYAGRSPTPSGSVHLHPRAVVTGRPPAPTEFDPAVDGLPEVLDPSRLPARGAGRVVTLLSAGAPDEAEWNQACAVAVAKAWAGEGVRVFLADLGLEQPTLHEILGVPNDEGISDMFRFGASVQRVAHRVGELPFFFTAAGAPVYEPEEILRSDRWKILIDGFAEASAALLLYLPAEAEGAEAILARTTDLIVLGQALPAAVERGAGPDPLAWITPAGAAAAGPAVTPAVAGELSEPGAEEVGSPEEFRSPADLVAGHPDDAEATSGDPEPGLEDHPGTGGEGDEGETLVDLEAGWGTPLESADTQTFEVPVGEPGLPEDHAEPVDEAWDAPLDGWEEEGAGLEVVPDEPQGWEDSSAAVDDRGFEPVSAREPEADPVLEPEAGPVLEAAPDLGPPSAEPELPESIVGVQSSDAEVASEASFDSGAGGAWDGPSSQSGWSGADEDPVPAAVSPEPDPAAPTAKRQRRGSRRWVVWGGAAAMLALVAWQLVGSGLLPSDGAGGAGGEPPPEGESAVSDAPAEGGSATGTDGAVPDDDPARAAETSNPPVDIDPGEPTSPLLDASLVIQSFADPAEAQDFADRLSESLGELLFTVVPSLVRGETWYRTVAGPARDVSEIPGIQQRIEQANLSILAGRTGWFARRTGMAFLLTEEHSLADADALALRYRGEGIPAYVLAIDYSAGVRLYRVYAGAYAAESEATPLARILADAGVEAELVPRLGSMPSDR